MLFHSEPFRKMQMKANKPRHSIRRGAAVERPSARGGDYLLSAQPLARAYKPSFFAMFLMKFSSKSFSRSLYARLCAISSLVPLLDKGNVFE